MCNNFGGCSWLVIIVLILLLFGGCGNGGVMTYNNGCGCGNDCGCNNGCGC